MGQSAKDRHDPTPPPLDPEESRSIFTAVPEPGPSMKAARDRLQERGIRVMGKYIGEIFTNATGGLKSGTAYDGRFRLSLDADFEKIAGAQGLTLHASALEIHGRGIDFLYVGSLMPPSNIEASRAARLYELWLQKDFLNGFLSIRAGEMAADQEFMFPIWATLFINGAFGWPVYAATNLPDGGPAYPLASLGARVAVNFTDRLTFMAAALNGDAAPPMGLFGNPDPQRRNPNGLQFRLKDPALLIAEAQIKYDLNGLGGVFKLGGWRHFGSFADQHWGVDSLSLADPNGAGVARSLRGNFGVYAILDQQIGAGIGPGRGAGVFLRAGAAPDDRNVVSLSADAGVSFIGFMDNRPDDLFGIGFGYTRISSAARNLDYDTAFFSNSLRPVRSSEELVEVTYIARMAAGWSLQPDIQFIMHPGGNMADPKDAGGTPALRYALVFGLRSLVRF
ncbi:MAG: carbohydrate porin [Methylocystis sp.]|uniref:carbohydrate porin n=1 Tax=Methylocystis sp. TaxID=1911079 RepID=UPI003DA29FD5